MFLPETNFKFVNISIVTYKLKLNKTLTFEVACYPNKLYEYKQIKTLAFLRDNFQEILQSDVIYKNIAQGEASDGLTELDSKIQTEGYEFSNEDKNLIRIKFILDNGYERKDKETTKQENIKVENELVNLIQKKIKYKGEYMTQEALRVEIISMGIISKCSIQKGGIKKLVSDVMKKLDDKEGFSRVEFIIELWDKENDCRNLTEFKEYQIEENIYRMPSDIMHNFTAYLNENSIDYFIRQEDEESEDIC
ncbi:SDO1 [Enterospora canceri]|uniref:SDO1 n=1 Tax=Enterospora canceri TaxID=1081671 RepID=A0A1Y1S5U1_9MICR|nr:SDO1 [Enterospora canceri]